MASKRPLVILQHEPIGPPGSIAAALRRLGVGFEVRRCDLGGALPAWPEEACGIVSLGGYMHVTQTDAFPFIAEETQLLRRVLNDHGPVLGICLGAQLLTLAAGGEVHQRATPAVGWSRIRGLKEDPLLEGTAKRFFAFSWREYSCIPPVTSDRLAHGGGDVQVFRVGEKAWAAQFHPELDEDMAPRWVQDAAAEHLSTDTVAAEHLAADTARYLPASMVLAHRVTENFVRATGLLANS